MPATRGRLRWQSEADRFYGWIPLDRGGAARRPPYFLLKDFISEAGVSGALGYFLGISWRLYS